MIWKFRPPQLWRTLARLTLTLGKMTPGGTFFCYTICLLLLPDRKQRSGLQALIESYIFLIDDRRYTVPSLRLISAENRAAAEAMAASALAESADHLAVHVYFGETLICSVPPETPPGFRPGEPETRDDRSKAEEGEPR